MGICTLGGGLKEGEMESDCKYSLMVNTTMATT